MNIVCAWCARSLGAKNQFTDSGTTHSICDECYRQVCASLGAEPSQSRAPRMRNGGEATACSKCLLGLFLVWTAACADFPSTARASANDVPGPAASKPDDAPTVAQRSTEQELDALWLALGDHAAYRSYIVVINRFLQISDDAVPFLARKLCSPSIAEEPARRLIDQLDDGRFSVRQAATDELERMGPAAAVAVRKTLATKPSLEVRVRLERLLLIWGEDAEYSANSPYKRRLSRAIQVLERIGTPKARAVLEKMLSEDRHVPWAKAQAAQSLELLRRIYGP